MGHINVIRKTQQIPKQHCLELRQIYQWCFYRICCRLLIGTFYLLRLRRNYSHQYFPLNHKLQSLSSNGLVKGNPLLVVGACCGHREVHAVSVSAGLTQEGSVNRPPTVDYVPPHWPLAIIYCRTHLNFCVTLVKKKKNPLKRVGMSEYNYDCLADSHPEDFRDYSSHVLILLLNQVVTSFSLNLMENCLIEPE